MTRRIAGPVTQLTLTDEPGRAGLSHETVITAIVAANLTEWDFVTIGLIAGSFVTPDLIRGSFVTIDLTAWDFVGI